MTWVQILHEGLDGQIDEVVRVAGQPSFRTVGMLETALRRSFLDTQARTHVITGSLKASGRSASQFDGNSWEGTITYGGPSTGPNNPVDYAIYEMNRGGAHDFFGGLPAFDADWREAINAHFRGGS